MMFMCFIFKFWSKSCGSSIDSLTFKAMAVSISTMLGSAGQGSMDSIDSSYSGLGIPDTARYESVMQSKVHNVCRRHQRCPGGALEVRDGSIVDLSEITA